MKNNKIPLFLILQLLMLLAYFAGAQPQDILDFDEYARMIRKKTKASPAPISRSRGKPILPPSKARDSQNTRTSVASESNLYTSNNDKCHNSKPRSISVPNQPSQGPQRPSRGGYQPRKVLIPPMRSVDVSPRDYLYSPNPDLQYYPAVPMYSDGYQFQEDPRSYYEYTQGYSRSSQNQLYPPQPQYNQRMQQRSPYGSQYGEDGYYQRSPGSVYSQSSHMSASSNPPKLPPKPQKLVKTSRPLPQIPNSPNYSTGQSHQATEFKDHILNKLTEKSRPPPIPTPRNQKLRSVLQSTSSQQSQNFAHVSTPTLFQTKAMQDAAEQRLKLKQQEERHSQQKVNFVDDQHHGRQNVKGRNKQQKEHKNQPRGDKQSQKNQGTFEKIRSMARGIKWLAGTRRPSNRKSIRNKTQKVVSPSTQQPKKNKPKSLFSLSTFKDEKVNPTQNFQEYLKQVNERTAKLKSINRLSQGTIYPRFAKSNKQENKIDPNNDGFLGSHYDSLPRKPKPPPPPPLSLKPKLNLTTLKRNYAQQNSPQSSPTNGRSTSPSLSQHSYYGNSPTNSLPNSPKYYGNSPTNSLPNSPNYSPTSQIHSPSDSLSQSSNEFSPSSQSQSSSPRSTSGSRLASVSSSINSPISPYSPQSIGSSHSSQSQNDLASQITPNPSPLSQNHFQFPSSNSNDQSNTNFKFPPPPPPVSSVRRKHVKNVFEPRDKNKSQQTPQQVQKRLFAVSLLANKTEEEVQQVRQHLTQDLVRLSVFVQESEGHFTQLMSKHALIQYHMTTFKSAKKHRKSSTPKQKQLKSAYKSLSKLLQSNNISSLKKLSTRDLLLRLQKSMQEVIYPNYNQMLHRRMLAKENKNRQASPTKLSKVTGMENAQALEHQNVMFKCFKGVPAILWELRSRQLQDTSFDGLGCRDSFLMVRRVMAVVEGVVALAVSLILEHVRDRDKSAVVDTVIQNLQIVILVAAVERELLLGFSSLLNAGQKYTTEERQMLDSMNIRIGDLVQLIGKLKTKFTKLQLQVRFHGTLSILIDIVREKLMLEAAFVTKLLNCR